MALAHMAATKVINDLGLGSRRCLDNAFKKLSRREMLRPDDLRWIEHRIAGTGLQMRLLKAYSNHTLCSKVRSYLRPLGIRQGVLKLNR